MLGFSPFAYNKKQQEEGVETHCKLSWEFSLPIYIVINGGDDRRHMGYFSPNDKTELITALLHHLFLNRVTIKCAIRSDFNLYMQFPELLQKSRKITKEKIDSSVSNEQRSKI